MKDDVRLFRIREDAIKDEFKSDRDKPLTDEEAEQMWKNVRGDMQGDHSGCVDIKSKVAF